MKQNCLYLLSPEAKDVSGGQATPLEQATKVVNTPNKPTPGDLTSGASKQNKVNDPNQKPPAEALKGEFSIDSKDSDLLGSTSPTVEVTRSNKDVNSGKEKPVVIVEKVEDKKKEEVVDPAKAKVEPVKGKDKTELTKETKSATDLNVSLDKSASTRDYTGYSAEEVTALKNMSRPSYEFAVKLIKQNKELSGLKDASYLQHPEAYRLTPEFTELSNQSYFLEQEAKHWEEQLLNIRAGRQWKGLQGFDRTTGKMILGNDQEPTDKDLRAIEKAVNQIDSALANTQGQMQQFGQGFGNKVKQDETNIQTEMAKRFEWCRDAKALDHTVNIPEVGEVTLKQIGEEFIGLFPQYMRNNSVMQVAKNMFIALQIYGQQIRELTEGKELAEFKKEEVLRVEPKSDIGGNADKGKGNGKFGKLDAFDLNGMPS